jgi:hypothetical protein
MLDAMNTGLYLEAHIVPRDPEHTESMPTDQPTDAVLDDAGDDQLQIRLTYDVQGLQQLNGRNVTSQVLHLRKDRSFQNLFFDLADFIASKLETDHFECYTYLRETQSYILLRPVLEDPCPVKRRAFDFDDSGIARVSTIGDLVSDADSKPLLNIRLRIIESLQRKVSTDPIVVIRSGATSKHFGGRFEFYRIGRVPKEKTGDPKVMTADTFFWRRSLVTQKLTLLKSRTWSLRNFDICNPDEGKNVVARQENALPSNTDECRNMLQNGSISPCLQGRLLYSFKTFGEELCCPEPVDAVPSSGLSVAFRFISHLNETSKISFNDKSELSLESNDDFGSLEKEIKDELSRKNNNHGDTTALFKEPLVNNWYMQFWILPQVPDGTTVYRFNADTPKLHCFLNKPDLEKGDTALFMEVHLLPKPVKQAAQSDSRGSRAAGRAHGN